MKDLGPDWNIYIPVYKTDVTTTEQDSPGSEQATVNITMNIWVLYIATNLTILIFYFGLASPWWYLS